MKKSFGKVLGVSVLVMILLGVSVIPVAAQPERHDGCVTLLKPGDTGTVVTKRLFVRNSSDNHPADNIVGFVYAGNKVEVLAIDCSWGWGMLRIKEENVTEWTTAYGGDKTGEYWIAENKGTGEYWVWPDEMPGSVPVAPPKHHPDCPCKCTK